MTILLLIETVFEIIWEMPYGRISLNSVLLLLLVNFCEVVQVGIDVYIHHRKHQVKPHSSPWFFIASTATIVHRNHVFRLYQQKKSFESKVKFRQESIMLAKVFLKLQNLHMLIKQKTPSLFRNLAPRTFDELLIVFSTKVNWLYLF